MLREMRFARKIFRQLGHVINLRLLFSGPLSSMYGLHRSTHRLGREHSWSARFSARETSERDFPRGSGTNEFGDELCARENECACGSRELQEGETEEAEDGNGESPRA